MNAWVTHVKNFASRNKMTYGCALSDPRCKSEYHGTKKKSARNPVSFVPKTKTQKPIKKVFKSKEVESDEEDTESDVSEDTESDVSEEPKQKLQMPDELSKVIQDFARPKKTPLTEAKMILKKVKPFVQKFVDETALELFKIKKEEGGVMSWSKERTRDFDAKRIAYRDELLDEIYDKRRESRERQEKADDDEDTKTYWLEQEVIKIYNEAKDDLSRYLGDDVFRIISYAVDDLQRAENKAKAKKKAEKKKEKAERETMGVEDKLSKQAEKERERERKRLKKLDNERKRKAKEEKEAKKELKGSGFSFWVEN